MPFCSAHRCSKICSSGKVTLMTTTLTGPSRTSRVRVNSQLILHQRRSQQQREQSTPLLRESSATQLPFLVIATAQPMAVHSKTHKCENFRVALQTGKRTLLVLGLWAVCLAVSSTPSLTGIESRPRIRMILARIAVHLEESRIHVLSRA